MSLIFFFSPLFCFPVSIESFSSSFLFICLCHYTNLFPPSLHIVFTSRSFSFLISPPSLLSWGGHCCQGSFPNLLILSFFISSPLIPTTYVHIHTHQFPSHHPSPPSALSSLSSLSFHPWHKCICSIPPANRLAGCYQRQGDSDNGFHHIFSLPQIKMGQVIRPHKHTQSCLLTNTCIPEPQTQSKCK